MNQASEFGNRLKKRRESSGKSLADIARVTKIPSHSLELLEQGRFSDLPGDVFVRGFLRSYARCVGLDPEDTVNEYGTLVTGSREVEDDEPQATEAQAAGGEEGESEREAVPAPRRESPTEQLRRISQALSEAGQGRSRISLTLAVIILVIVATVTLSLLLKAPGDVGEGITLLHLAR